MGSFGAVVGKKALLLKALPLRTTSEQRFQMSSGAMPRPAINALGSFNRPGGPGFPGGNAMTPLSLNFEHEQHAPLPTSTK